MRSLLRQRKRAEKYFPTVPTFVLLEVDVMSHSTDSADVNKLLQAEVPTRVLILVRHQATLRRSPDEIIIHTSLSYFKVEPSQSQRRFVAKEMWDIVDMYIVDLYHNAYNFAKAHYPEMLPVVTVDHGRRGIKLYMASSGRQRHVNNQVADLHNLHGYDAQLPLVSDHSHGRVPRYHKLRDVSMLYPEGRGLETAGESALEKRLQVVGQRR